MKLEELDNVLKKCSRINISYKKLSESTLSELILISKFVKSRTEARRLISNNSVKINGDIMNNDKPIKKEDIDRKSVV